MVLHTVAINVRKGNLVEAEMAPGLVHQFYAEEVTHDDTGTHILADDGGTWNLADLAPVDIIDMTR